MRYEYTVIAAPSRGDKVKGAKTPVDRFALSLTAELNRMAGEGWDYIRAETLPSEERSGLTGRSTVYHNVLVFRRATGELESAPASAVATTPQPEYPISATPARAPEKAPEPPLAAAPQRIDHSLVSEKPAIPPAPRVGPSGD